VDKICRGNSVEKEFRDMTGKTPLHFAVSKDLYDVVEKLLDQKCDPQTVANSGNTLLHTATINCNINMVKLLFQWGVKLDHRNNDQRTAIDIARKRKNRAPDIAGRRKYHEIETAIESEDHRRNNHGLKRDRSTIEGTEEHEASKRPRVETETQEDASDSDDDSIF